jgi:predicted metal-dependent peptidase
MNEKKNLDDIGLEILRSAQSQLYLNLPYLDVALCTLRFQPGGTAFAATDGETLFFSGHYLADRFLHSQNLVNRLYLHTVLHCLLRHLGKKRGRDGVLWDLASDIAVESVVDSLEKPCLEAATAIALRQKVYGEMRAEMPVLTAEGIYRALQRRKLPEYELARLQKEFFADDHGLWDMDQSGDDQDQRWRDLSGRAQTAMDTVLAGQATGGEAVYEQVKVSSREDVDYRAFLRRFAAPREVLEVDGDGFDYIFYTYGLRRYGNLPLIEPPETKEQWRIEDFVIAIDTSMSTSGDTVRAFLSATYNILRSAGTFTRRVNIRILQCDDQLRRDDVINDLDELRAYMEDFHLVGGSATDFRPVFTHVEQLRKQGAFHHLRGIVYFTDGMGIFPKKPPDYAAAFILLREPPMAVQFPPWAIKLVLGEEELQKANDQPLEGQTTT